MAASEKNTGALKKKQARMGPAPIASFEDLSEEKKNEHTPEELPSTGSVVRLPGIREDASPSPHSPRQTASFAYPVGISLVGAPHPVRTKSPLPLPHAPRIDISRASSTSKQSMDSTPERELYDQYDPHTAKLGHGFQEDGALELRSSTEDLPTGWTNPAEDRRTSTDHERKDSQCSELLEVLGRTSRVSSIGSQGSACSRISNLSGSASRCSSPYKLVLETSFCGNKNKDKTKKVSVTDEEKESEVLEQVMLSRKHDPTQAMVAEVSESGGAKSTIKESRKSTTPEAIGITITVHEPNSSEIITLEDNQVAPGVPQSRNVSANGVEYFYIPLKGKLPDDVPSKADQILPQRKQRETRSANVSPADRRRLPGFVAKTHNNKKSPKQGKPVRKTVSDAKERRSRNHSPYNTNEPLFQRIRLKPDHEYDVNESDKLFTPQDLSVTNTPQRIMKPNTLDIISVSPKKSKSGSPTPSTSRRSSFSSLFRSREVTPDSPRRPSTISSFLQNAGEQLKELSLKNRQRSNSRDTSQSLSAGQSSNDSLDTKPRRKSLLSLLRITKSPDFNDGLESSSQETIEMVVKPKKTVTKQKTPDVIHVPLHSPAYYDNRTILQNFSQESQDTVIEADIADNTTAESTHNNISKVEENCSVEDNYICKQEMFERNDKQLSKESNTSSENVTFTTSLNNNGVFSTKLPKENNVSAVDIVIHQIPNTDSVEDDLKQIKDQNLNFQKDTLLENKDKSQTSVATSEPFFDTSQKSFDSSEFEYDKQTKDNKSAKNSIPQKDVTSQRESDKSKKVIKRSKESYCDEKDSEELFPSNNNNYEIKREASCTSMQAQCSSARSSAFLDDSKNSSDSERDSETSEVYKTDGQITNLRLCEQEIKGLVLQTDSFEDELPYVPTTLPLERPSAAPIMTLTQRSAIDIVTIPIERPRSTTPINPSSLEFYCEEIFGYVESVSNTIEKIKIKLPVEDQIGRQQCKKALKKNWQDFSLTKTKEMVTQESPPPLPPKGMQNQKEWINFDKIPEKRRHAKRIQTIPGRENKTKQSNQDVLYNFVNPEECLCECHDHLAHHKKVNPKKEDVKEPEEISEELIPLLEDATVEECATNNIKVRFDSYLYSRSHSPFLSLHNPTRRRSCTVEDNIRTQGQVQA